ncbi:hypothetical protein D9M70_534480 [compost metagenome]
MPGGIERFLAAILTTQGGGQVGIGVGAIRPTLQGQPAHAFGMAPAPFAEQRRAHAQRQQGIGTGIDGPRAFKGLQRSGELPVAEQQAAAMQIPRAGIVRKTLDGPPCSSTGRGQQSRQLQHSFQHVESAGIEPFECQQQIVEGTPARRNRRLCCQFQASLDLLNKGLGYLVLAHHISPPENAVSRLSV